MAHDGPLKKWPLSPRSCIAFHTIVTLTFTHCRLLKMDVEVIAAAAIYLLSTYNHYRNVHQKKVVKSRWRKRRWWMLTIHRNRTRQTMNMQLAELLAEPSREFDNFVRMSSSDFEYLVQKISPMVTKKDTFWRESIPVKIRLAVTLRYLATGDSYRSLHYLFKISSQVISKIIPEVCLALNIILKDYIKGKLIKLFSRQLVTKAKIKDVELSFDLYNIPCLSQWLRVVGLCQNSIEKVCYRVSNLEMLQEKSDHELRALLSTARDEEIRRLCRAMFNLKKYTEVVMRGAAEVDIPLYWDSWDRHHLQEGSPRGGRARTTRASLPSEDTLGLTNNALDPTTHKKVWIKFPTTPPARRPQQHLATGTDLVGADGSKEVGVGGAALTKSRSHESQLVVRQDLLHTELSNDVCVSAVDPSPVPATTPAPVTQPSPPAASLETHAPHPQSEDTIHKSLTTPRSPRTPTVPRCMAHYIAHRFTKTFKMKATCDYCDKPMFLGAGLKCKECKYKCHRDCESKVPASCGLPQEFVEEFRRLLESDGTVYPSNQSPGLPRRLSGLDGGGGAAGVGGVGGVGGIGGVSGVGALSSTIATIPKHKRPRQHHISANTPFTCGQDSSSNTSSCNSSTPSSPAPATPHTPRTPVPSLTHLKHQFHFPEVKKGHSLSGILAVGAGAEDTCLGSSVTPASPARGVVAPPTTQSAQSVSLSTCVEGEVSWSSSASAASERPAARADTTDSDAGHTPAACPAAPAQPDDRWPRQNSLSMKEWDIPWDELHLGEVLGQGRFGTVYRGSWHGAIAVKVLNVQYLQDDEGALNSFKHEVATFRKTRHENLVLFMGACMKPPKQAIVTSLCKGNTLYTLIHLRKDKFTMNKAAIVAQQISQGMGYLHARGILHKDLKSKNIFLENGKVVITDFGLFSVTKLCFGNNAQADSIGIPAGWLCYLAPELVRALRPRQPGAPGDLPFSTATDVYSFGTVWYELLCGEWPFKGQPPESVIWQVGTGVKQALSSLQASRDVKDILMLCWSYRRAERPDFARLLSTLEKLPRKRLARSPSHPLHLSRSAESVF